MICIGLDAVGIKANKKSKACQERKFHLLFGSSPKVAVEIWNNIAAATEKETRLEPSKVTRKGVVAYLKGLHFLWAYPKNAKILATMF